MGKLAAALRHRASELEAVVARGTLPSGQQLSEEGKRIIQLIAQEDRRLAREVQQA